MLAIYEIILWPLLRLIALVTVLPLTIRGLLKKKKWCPPVEDRNLLIPAKQLVKKIITQKLTCTSVVTSYINRIKTVNPILNAVVEDRFEEALAEAAAIDNLIATSKLSAEELETKYPLLGVPMTIKESISVKGLSNAAGSCYYKGRKGEEDAEIVTFAKKAGAIVLLVSNTPELCLNWETSNNITGTTSNPYDTRRTAGGSSGGEAALMGAGASLVGLGSDIAGSLRLPAHFCGVFGHKPTSNSVSIAGHFPWSTDTARWHEYFSLGPMARYAEDLPLLMNVIVKDEFRPLLNLNKPVDIKKLKFYYLDNSESVLINKTSEEVADAIREVVNYLKEYHDIDTQKLNLKHFKHAPALTLMPLLSVEGLDKICPDSSIYLEFTKYLFRLTKSTLSAIMYFLVFDLAHKLFSEGTFDKFAKKKATARDELETLLGDDGVLILPTFPRVAPYHGMYICRLLDYTYTAMFNALGLPVTNCPIRFSSNGLPIGIQIIAKRNCDRLTMAVAREIEIGFGGWKQAPNKGFK